MIKYETDLYLPVQHFFSELGYKVDAEVKIAILLQQKRIQLLYEFKRGFTIELVYQLVNRKKMTPYVYAVIPRPKNMRSSTFRKKLDVLRALECGLLVVLNSTKRVDVILEPKGKDTSVKQEYRKGIVKEVNVRKMALNLGGQTRRKIVTAHKESLISIMLHRKIRYN